MLNIILIDTRMNTLKELEIVEWINFMRRLGHGDFIDALLDHDVYTKTKGRLNKSALCRKTNLSLKEINGMLSELRQAQ